jgi:hypothetical protein
MDETTLKRLLQGSAEGISKPIRRCPDSADLAAYADQQLSGNSKEMTEKHLSSCDSCLAQVAFLAKSSDWTDPALVPAHMLSGARSLVSRKPPANVWEWRWTVATAALACLVFAIILGIAWQLRRSNKSADPALIAETQPTQSVVPFPASPTPVESPTAFKSSTPEPISSPRQIKSPSPAVRRATQLGVAAPSVLFPTERATVSSAELVFRWSAINDAESYEVTLMTDAGDVVFTDHSTQTELKLPGHLTLTSGGKYFVQVTANMPQGNTIKSSVVGFRVSH